jgi:hypothetical protein
LGGFAITPDGTKLFIHKNNFNHRNTSLVEGTKIQFELRPEVDAFTESLEAGDLRDKIGRHHRNPRRVFGTAAQREKRHPTAIKIKVMPHA